ncbi:hypothetical protein QE152_g5933 [Popillia japonica]|uniref:Uncharacterized protein n=1 Tax=Popillia japonica TaxID=7064 RepID=A0AAW1MMC7_POPJA
MLTIIEGENCKNTLQASFVDHFVENEQFYVELGNMRPTGSVPQKYAEILQASFVDHFVENEQFYVELGNMRPTGSVPQKYDQIYVNEFGLDGSFRKLNID